MNDPTHALFLSPASAETTAIMLKARYPKTVRMTSIKPRMERGACKGYLLVAHKSDGTSEPITNSDVERIQNGLQDY